MVTRGVLARSCLKSLESPTKGQPWELWEPPASEGVVNLLKKSIAGLDSEIWCIYISTLSIIYILQESHQITSNHIKSPDLMVPDPRAASKSLPNSLIASRASYSICTVIKFETAKPFPWKGSSKHQPKGLRWMTLVLPGSLQFLRLSALVQAQVWRRLQHQRSHSFESLEQASRLRLPSWLHCKCECYMLRDVTRLFLELSYSIETSTSQHYLDLPLLVLAAFRCLSHTRCLENWDLRDRPRMC